MENNAEKCKKCKKELLGDEEKYCSHCRSIRNTGIRKTLSIVGGSCLTAGAVILTVFTKGKFGPK